MAASPASSSSISRTRDGLLRANVEPPAIASTAPLKAASGRTTQRRASNENAVSRATNVAIAARRAATQRELPFNPGASKSAK